MEGEATWRSGEECPRPYRWVPIRGSGRQQGIVAWKVSNFHCLCSLRMSSCCLNLDTWRSVAVSHSRICLRFSAGWSSASHQATISIANTSSSITRRFPPRYQWSCEFTVTILLSAWASLGQGHSDGVKPGEEGTSSAAYLDPYLQVGIAMLGVICVVSSLPFSGEGIVDEVIRERPLFSNATIHRLSERLIELLKQDVRFSLRELSAEHKQVGYLRWWCEQLMPEECLYSEVVPRRQESRDR